MEQHPPFGGDRARDYESSSVERRKAQNTSLDISHHAESRGGDNTRQAQFLQHESIASEKFFRAPNFARDRDRHSDREATCSDACSTPADSCAPAASTDVVRSAFRYKLPSRVRGVKQPIHAPSGARSCDRDSASFGRRRRAPGIPMSSRTS